MRVQDFGRMDGPVYLFGGPYSNLYALEAISRLIGDADAICTGDIVAYGGNPAETISLMRALNVPTIAGNCERQIAEGADDCGCGFEEGSTCNVLSKGWYPFALAACDPDAVSWLGDLPELGVFNHQAKRYAVVHGGATSINRFLWPSSSDTDFLEEITALEGFLGAIDGVIAGHSGIAFHRRVDGYDWINAGVIGLPPHDARPETRYAILHDEQVVFERLSYDHQSACNAMEAAGLSQGYQKTLLSGVWPSEDVLPTALRR